MNPFINIFVNLFKQKNFFEALKKLIKKFEKNTSSEAKNWAKLNTKYSTEEFCRSIDNALFDKILADIKLIENEAKEKLLKLNVNIGGSGNYVLLYFLVIKFRPNYIVETGVAAGWSSLAILRGLKKNNTGYLFSSDLPYYRIKNPNQYIGYLAKNEENKKNWYLDIRGDDLALPEISKRIANEKINLFHYDSDKSYYARNKALNILSSNIDSETIIIFDDIQDNVHFKNLVKKTKQKYCILEFQNKFVGILGDKIFINNEFKS